MDQSVIVFSTETQKRLAAESEYERTNNIFFVLGLLVNFMIIAWNTSPLLVDVNKMSFRYFHHPKS